MAAVTKKEIDQDVLRAVRYLEEAEVFAFPKTIVSFLMGKTASPHYDSVFRKHKDVCGIYTNISEETVSDSLGRLYKDGYLERTVTSKGKILYLVKKQAVKKAAKVTTKKEKTPKKPKSRNYKLNFEYRFYDYNNKYHAKIVKEGKLYVIRVFGDEKVTLYTYECSTIEQAKEIIRAHNTKDSYAEFLKSGGKVTQPKNKKPSPPEDKPKPDSFYKTASLQEKSILDEFRRLVKSLLPDHELDDEKPYIYPFVPKVITDDHKNRVWISRDQKTRKLKLHYKKKAGGPESEPLDLTTRKKIDEAWRVLRVAFSTTGTEVQGIIDRIKKGDTFNDYQTEDVVDISLMPHQKAGVELAQKYDRFAFFYDTGTGKTVMALQIMMEKQKNKKGRFLVVAPKALIKSAWMDDSKYFPKMKLLPLSTNMTTEDYARIYDNWQVMDGGQRAFTDEDGNLIEKIPNKLKEDILNDLYTRANHFIVNIDAIREPKKGNALLRKIKINGLIIDESVIIKNYRSGNARRMRVFAKKMKYVYLLSGKPAPNTTIEYYSQMVIIDPKTFDITYDSFISKYYQEVRIGKYVDKNDKTRATVAKMVGNRSIIIKKEECIQLPEAFHQKREVEIDSETLRFYNDVFKNFITEIVTMEGERLKVRRMSKLGSIMKLREIASGFYLDKDGSYKLNPHKVRAVIDLVDEIGVQDNGKPNKVLIWCTFKYEIKVLEKELSKLGYNVVTAYSESGRALDGNIEAFKHGNADIMIAHPQTLKYGVTFTCCHYCIFSSMSYSYDDYYQAHDRIYRNGQEEVCFFYHLLSENTIDEIIYKCVIEKADKSKLFERLVKSASKHGFSKEEIINSLKVPAIVKDIATNENDLTGYC